jgi:hypothetical protein
MDLDMSFASGSANPYYELIFRIRESIYYGSTGSGSKHFEGGKASSVPNITAPKNFELLGTDSYHGILKSEPSYTPPDLVTFYCVIMENHVRYEQKNGPDHGAQRDVVYLD